jgi:hypothetical protein
MLAVAKREKEGWLREEDAEKFPCKELRSIDQLWLKYSRGKFGISVQQQIYQSLGGTKEYKNEVWESMGDRVGWRQGGNFLAYNELNFSQTAPSGQLPTINIRVQETENARLIKEFASTNARLLTALLSFTGACLLILLWSLWRNGWRW